MGRPTVIQLWNGWIFRSFKLAESVVTVLSFGLLTIVVKREAIIYSTAVSRR